MSHRDWTEARPLVFTQPLGSPSPPSPPQVAPGGALTNRENNVPADRGDSPV